MSTDASRPPTLEEQAARILGHQEGFRVGLREGFRQSIDVVDQVSRAVIGPEPGLTDDGAVALAALRQRLVNSMAGIGS